MKRLILNQEELSELEVLQVLGGAFCQYGRRDILTYQIVEESQSPVLRISTHLHGTCPEIICRDRQPVNIIAKMLGLNILCLGI